jgi:hypothetical protein
MFKTVLKRLNSLMEELEDIKLNIISTLEESYDLELSDVRDILSEEGWKPEYGEEDEDGMADDDLGDDIGAEDAAEQDAAESMPADDEDGFEDDDEDLGDDIEDDDMGDEADTFDDMDGDVDEGGSEEPSSFDELDDGDKFKFVGENGGEEEFTKVSDTEYENEEGKKFTLNKIDSEIELIPEQPEGEDDLEGEMGDELGGDELGGEEPAPEEGGEGDLDLGDEEPAPEEGEEDLELNGKYEEESELKFSKEEVSTLDNMLSQMIEEVSN